MIEEARRAEESTAPFVLRAYFAVWFALLALLFLGILVFIFSLATADPNHIIVTNSSGGAIQDTRLILRGGSVGLCEESWGSLAAGETRKLTLRGTDFACTLEFAIAGEPRIFTTPYVDFWPGDDIGYVIRPGGEVREVLYPPAPAGD